MSTRFDTTPTAEDLAAARTKLGAAAVQYSGSTNREWRLAALVAIELGVVLARLEASNELDARSSAQARALFDEWMCL